MIDLQTNRRYLQLLDLAIWIRSFGIRRRNSGTESSRIRNRRITIWILRFFSCRTSQCFSLTSSCLWYRFGRWARIQRLLKYQSLPKLRGI